MSADNEAVKRHFCEKIHRNMQLDKQIIKLDFTEYSFYPPYTLNELLKIASEAHIARLMTGKAGILHLHLGDGERGLSLVREALSTAEIPARIYNPTHINRRKALFHEACELAKQGCWVDVTAFETGDVGYEPAKALMRYMQQALPQDKPTISLVGGVCLPCFDYHGHMTKMDFASSS